MPYRFYTADVFTDRPFGGNPLAVIPDARGLTGEQMQRVAREFNLSETTFVLPPERPEHTRQVRILTPSKELPFAGHPTVGTAFVLAASGELALEGEQTRIVFEEGVGPVPVTLHAKGGKPIGAELTTAQLPDFGPPPPATAALASVLGLEPDDVLQSELTPEAVSCGVPFLLLPLRNRAALARARLDYARWEHHLARFWADQVYLFTRDTGTPGVDIQARMFAPGMGISEDPATGAAAAALAGYLGKRVAHHAGVHAWRIAQGVEMGRPSTLDISVDTQDSAVRAVRVGGASVLITEGTLFAPTPEDE